MSRSKNKARAKKTARASASTPKPAGADSPNWTFTDSIHRSHTGSHSARRTFTVSMDPANSTEPTTPTPSRHKAKSKVHKPIDMPRVRASTPFLFEAYENRTSAKGLKQLYPYAFRCDGEPRKEYRDRFDKMKAAKLALQMSKFEMERVRAGLISGPRDTASGAFKPPRSSNRTSPGATTIQQLVDRHGAEIQALKQRMEQQELALDDKINAKFDPVAAKIQETLTKATRHIENVVSQGVRRARPGGRGYRGGPRSSAFNTRGSSWRPSGR
ncbi:hypothetical protein DBV05_g2908 [Lasiodiplodia theobromae]|uniref:Uncharacterized protein n=1 Tax=Lasiodiplodia theobromae TaxID=45133 RepID=A0A5N5DL45_9PEZI|nr:hypothetical protein DBV05_g2908 [Lasiodiplodia theobromae]